MRRKINEAPWCMFSNGCVYYVFMCICVEIILLNSHSTGCLWQDLTARDWTLKTSYTGREVIFFFLLGYPYFTNDTVQVGK